MKDLKTEIIRKIFHFVACASVPIFLHFFDYNLIKKVLILLTIIVFAFDYLNLYEKLPKNPFISFLTSVARNHEKQKYSISGMTWAFLAFTILLLFEINKSIIGLSFLVLAISDTFSAFIGINFGKTKIFDKSFEGFVAFLLSAFFISISYLKILEIDINFIKLVIVCFFTGVFELFAKKIKIDDNFLVPIIFCFSYEVFSII